MRKPFSSSSGTLPRADSWISWPAPLIYPLDKLEPRDLYAMQLAHNFARVDAILGSSLLGPNAMLRLLKELIDRRYLCLTFVVLRFIAGPLVGKRQRFMPERPLVIGRDAKSVDVHLPDDRSSRRHARLVTTPGHFFIEDLDSRNGTFVNGEPVFGPTTIIDGDRILIGDSIIEVFIEFGTDAEANTEEQRVSEVSSEFDIDVSVDTMVVDAIGDVATLLEETIDESELRKHLSIASPLDAPLGDLSALELQVLQLAHNLHYVEAILMNAPTRERVSETMSTLRKLITLGYLR